MKPLLLLMTGLLSLAGHAQSNTSLNQSIDDNGKHLSIKIKGSANGKVVDYNQVFEVTGMNKEQKNALEQRVYDSLGLPSTAAPVAALPAVASVTVLQDGAGAPTVTSKSQYTEICTVGGDHPFVKEITYNPRTGILHMKYRFLKNGNETTLEKTMDAKDTSKEEREQIIKKYEKEIGVLQTEAV